MAPAPAAPHNCLPVELAHEIVTGDRRLGQDRSECAGFEGAVIGHGESCLGAVRVGAQHGDVITFPDQNETEPLEGPDYVSYGSVDGKLGP